MGQYCKGWGAMRSSQEEIKKYSKDFLYLLCCAVNDLTPEQSRVRLMNPEIMMNLADLHGVSAMTSYALYKSGLGGDFRAQWKQTMDQSQRKAALYEIERQSIRRYCKQERIRYMFLKGHLMQQYYPVYGMREMSDIDILAEQNARPLLQAFLSACGYTMEEIGESNHDAYHREPFFNVEVHVGLFRPELEPVFTEYYKDIFDRLIPGEGTEQHFSKEDFYIYHILHAVKHLHYGGIGVKALTDTCLLLRKETGLDWTYIAKETKKLSVEDDEKLLRKTAQKKKTACCTFWDQVLSGRWTIMYRTACPNIRKMEKLQADPNSGILRADCIHYRIRTGRCIPFSIIINGHFHFFPFTDCCVRSEGAETVFWKR